MKSMELAAHLKNDLERLAKLGGPQHSSRRLAGNEVIVVKRLATLWEKEDPAARVRVSWTVRFGERRVRASIRRGHGAIETFKTDSEPLDVTFTA